MAALSPPNPPTSFLSALDLRGLTRDLPIQEQGQPSTQYTNGQATPAAVTSLGQSYGPSLLPPSPGSGASCSTMSVSLPSIASISRPTHDASFDSTGDQGVLQPGFMTNRPIQPTLYPLRVTGTSHSAMYQTVSSLSGLTTIGPPKGQFPDSPTLVQSSSQGPPAHDTYNGISVPSFSTFSTPPYATFIPPQPVTAGSFEGPDTISSGGPFSPKQEDDYEAEVVPPSAPLDARGQVPFVFDHNYEARSMLLSICSAHVATIPATDQRTKCTVTVRGEPETDRAEASGDSKRRVPENTGNYAG